MSGVGKKTNKESLVFAKRGKHQLKKEMDKVRKAAEEREDKIKSEYRLLLAKSAGIPHDLYRMVEKAIKLGKHVIRQPKDEAAHNRLARLRENVENVADSYKEFGKLPRDWKYQSFKQN